MSSQPALPQRTGRVSSPECCSWQGMSQFYTASGHQSDPRGQPKLGASIIFDGNMGHCHPTDPHCCRTQTQTWFLVAAQVSTSPWPQVT